MYTFQWYFSLGGYGGRERTIEGTLHTQLPGVLMEHCLSISWLALHLVQTQT